MGKIIFSSDGMGFSREDTNVTEKMVRDYFKTDEDKEQAAPTKEIQEWIIKNGKDYLNVIKDNNKVIGFSFILPATKELMNSFLKKEINERQLFQKIMNNKTPINPQVIYLCSTIIEEGYRRRGLSVDGTLKLLEKFKKNEPILFSWSFSKGGENLANKISKVSGLKLLSRKD